MAGIRVCELSPYTQVGFGKCHQEVTFSYIISIELKKKDWHDRGRLKCCSLRQRITIYCKLWFLISKGKKYNFKNRHACFCSMKMEMQFFHIFCRQRQVEHSGVSLKSYVSLNALVACSGGNRGVHHEIC